MTGRKGLLVKNAHGNVQWVQRRSEVRHVPTLPFSDTRTCHACGTLSSDKSQGYSRP